MRELLHDVKFLRSRRLLRLATRPYVKLQLTRMALTTLILTLTSPVLLLWGVFIAMRFIGELFEDLFCDAINWIGERWPISPLRLSRQALVRRNNDFIQTVRAYKMHLRRVAADKF